MNLIVWKREFNERLAMWLRSLFLRLLNELNFRYIFLATIIFVILNWLFAFGLFLQSGDQQIILHYTTQFGANKIGGAAYVFVLPAIGTGVALLNLFFAHSLRMANKINISLALFAGLVFNQIVLSGLYSIFLINFR